MRSAAALFGADTPFDPSCRYVTSWVVAPRWLAAWRLLLALYAFLTTFIDLGLVGFPSDAQSFSYFTHLTYWGLAFYMLVAGLHTLAFARSGGTAYPLQRWPRCLQAAYASFYAANLVFPPIVTITFWTILFKGMPWFPARLDQWSNISMHAMNTGVYMLSELLLTCGPLFAPLSLLVLVVILCLYLALAYLTFDTQHFYTYSFLNPDIGPAHRAAYIVGILVACIVIWLLLDGLLWLRNRLTRGKQKGVAFDHRQPMPPSPDVDMAQRV